MLNLVTVPHENPRDFFNASIYFYTKTTGLEIMVLNGNSTVTLAGEDDSAHGDSHFRALQF